MKVNIYNFPFNDRDLSDIMLPYDIIDYYEQENIKGTYRFNSGKYFVYISKEGNTIELIYTKNTNKK